jgi:DNA-binding XRE family transcriptional regulator
MQRDAQFSGEGVGTDLVGDVDDDVLAHDERHNAKLLSVRQDNNPPLRQVICPDTFAAMSDVARPFPDISDRLSWHRELLGLTQEEYAAKLGMKRARYGLWEAGTHRLSLDGALAIRRTFGLSLDFMYEGIDDALPMTLRNAWRERPAVNASR